MLRKLVTSDSYRKSCRPVVISPITLGPIGKDISSCGIPVYALGLNSLFRLPVALYLLFRLVKLYNPEIIQTWMYHADLIGGIIGRLSGVKVIIWGIRNTDIYFGNGLSILTFFLSRVCSVLSYCIPTRIVCVATSAAISHKNIGYDLAKIVVIPNGVTIPDLSLKSIDKPSFCKHHNIPQDSILIGSICRYNYYKDIPFFLECASEVARLSDNYYFLLIGPGLDPTNSELTSLLSDFCLRDRFLLLGEQSDITAYCKLMTIFCLHSRSEGFPNVLVEAMSCSLPVVATDVGDVQYILPDHKFLVQHGDTQNYVKAMKYLLQQDSESLHSIGSTNNFYVASNFSIDHIITLYQDLYSSIL